MTCIEKNAQRIGQLNFLVNLDWFSSYKLYYMAKVLTWHQICARQIYLHYVLLSF